MKKVILTTLLQLCFFAGWSQTLSNTVKGKILDAQSGSALPGVHVILVGSEPLIGIQSDQEGIFRLPLVPLGRQPVLFRFETQSECLKNDFVLAA